MKSIFGEGVKPKSECDGMGGHSKSNSEGGGEPLSMCIGEKVPDYLLAAGDGGIFLCEI